MRLALLAFLTLVFADSSPTSMPTLVYDQGGIVRGDVTQKRLSLIFTGGEFADGVPTILRVCATQKVPAHFFVTGDFLRLHPKESADIIAAGHLLGPHGHSHLLYCDWNDRSRSLVTREQFRQDLQANLDELKAIGAPPSRYFVPPFEWYNAEQVEWAEQMGLKLVNFTPGSGSNRDYIPEDDPKFSTSEKLLGDILRYEQTSEHGLNGFLLLMHAGSKRVDKMHSQLDRLVVELKQRGYTFVTLDEMFR